jgi:superfamily II DNA/RNA helicase
LIETVPLPENTTAPADLPAHAESGVETSCPETIGAEPAQAGTVAVASPALVPDVPAQAEAQAPDAPAPAEATSPATEAVAAAVPVEAETGAAATPAVEAGKLPAEPEPEAAPPEAEVDERGFAELGLSDPLLQAIAEMGYTTPTPIQQQAIPVVLMGRDMLGVAQTGTGKTAGFLLPMLDILSGSRARARMPRSLILEPTRELALQVAENFVQYGKYLKLTHALLIGGESMSDQKDLLMRGVDVLIATPGRLFDMFERGGLLLTDTRILVIDETDRMLDMGFIPDVERIVGLLPANRQTLFFSATMGPEIRRLADTFLHDPKQITVSKSASSPTTIIQQLTLIAVHDKREALRRLIRSEDVQNALIFCNRKRDVDVLYKSLTKHGFSVGALHGDMAQSVRFSTLEKFKPGEVRLLCCSDVAARGLDIGGLSHVFNFDVPIHAEDYVHRIGRTGRAGREGHSFVLATPEDRLAVEAIEKLIGHVIPHVQIEALDPVDWAEDDGRRGRRGRGRPPVRARAEPTARTRAEPTARVKAEPAARVKAEPAARVKAEPTARPERKPRPERKIEPRPALAAKEREELPAVLSERPRFEHARREHRRDDDLGPPVVGFGDDVPAFMRIVTRARRPAAAATPEVGETDLDA